ncbi:MAG: hypothetical protein AAFP81_14440, partial [Pseudomonadota bacterium]
MVKMKLAAAVMGLAAGGLQTVSAETLLLGDPAIHENKIAFVYAGDLYTANIDGSEPHRLTTHV